jgi:RND family efflux transporter MFP subunit
MRASRSFSFFVLFLVLAAGTFVGPAAAATQLYTCGMHPQIIKQEPGNCPICGMALVPIHDHAGASKATATATAAGERKIKYWKSSMNPGEISPKPGKDSMGMDLVPVYEETDTPSAGAAVQLDAATIQRMNLKTGLVTRGPVLREFRTVGTIAYDEAGLRDITTKYEGWIEKLFVDTTWTAVKAGDPLFEIYSPDLYNAELNYLVALRGADAGSESPIARAALARLKLFDLSDDAIADLRKRGEASRTFVYRAPAAGVVIEKNAIAGQMIKAGERVFRLADLSSVWVLAQIYEQDLPFVRAGQDATVRVSYGPEHTIESKVDLLLPQVEDQTRTATARIVLPNPDGTLRPGMFVDVRLAAQIAADAVLVPDLAVLRSGERDTVFIARDDGSFEPREVRLGVRSQGDRYQVLSGLAGGERVVTSGQFMLDSESQLRDAIQKMLNASEAPSGTAAGAAPSPADHATPMSMPTPPASNSIGMEDSSQLPPEARAALTSLALATTAAGEALASDDLPAYRKQIPRVHDALTAFFGAYDRAAGGPLGRFSGGLQYRADLKSARRDFAYFSTAVTDLTRENHLAHANHLRVFECPMAPGIGRGRWLQHAGGVHNPFYGSAMPDCGEELP